MEFPSTVRNVVNHEPAQGVSLGDFSVVVKVHSIQRLLPGGWDAFVSWCRDMEFTIHTDGRLAVVSAYRPQVLDPITEFLEDGGLQGDEAPADFYRTESYSWLAFRDAVLRQQVYCYGLIPLTGTVHPANDGGLRAFHGLDKRLWLALKEV